MTEVDTDDGFLALKHIFLATDTDGEFQPGDYHEFRTRFRLLAKLHCPFEMAARMMLKPLEPGPPGVRAIVPPVVSAARFLLSR